MKIYKFDKTIKVSLSIFLIFINFIQCKLKSDNDISDEDSLKNEKGLDSKNQGNLKNIKDFKRINKKDKIESEKLEKIINKKDNIKYKPKSGGDSTKEQTDTEEQHKEESPYKEEGEEEPDLEDDDQINETSDDQDMENDPTKLIDEENDNFKVSVKYEHPDIMLPKDKQNLKVPTVYFEHPQGAHFLPYEYTRHGPKYQEDKKWLGESQKKSIRENLSTVEDMGLVNKQEHKNKGMSSTRFKIKYMDVKKLTFPSYTRHIRKELNRRKLATRAMWAYCNKNEIDPNTYKSIVLLSFLRPRKPGENIFRKILSSIFLLFIQTGNDPKKMVLSVNNIQNQKFKEFLKKSDTGVITPENTKLDLLEVFIPRKSDEKDHSMDFTNQMKILDESTLLCYNAEFKDPITGKIRQRNDKLYYRKIAEFDWLPLGDLSEENFTLPEKKYSFQKSIHQRVKKKFLNIIWFLQVKKNMIFIKNLLKALELIEKEKL